MSDFVTNILAGGFPLGITTGLGLLAWTLKKLTALEKNQELHQVDACAERKAIDQEGRNEPNHSNPLAFKAFLVAYSLAFFLL